VDHHLIGRKEDREFALGRELEILPWLPVPKNTLPCASCTAAQTTGSVTSAVLVMAGASSRWPSLVSETLSNSPGLNSANVSWSTGAVFTACATGTELNASSADPRTESRGVVSFNPHW